MRDVLQQRDAVATTRALRAIAIWVANEPTAPRCAMDQNAGSRLRLHVVPNRLQRRQSRRRSEDCRCAQERSRFFPESPAMSGNLAASVNSAYDPVAESEHPRRQSSFRARVAGSAHDFPCSKSCPRISGNLSREDTDFMSPSTDFPVYRISHPRMTRTRSAST